MGIYSTRSYPSPENKPGARYEAGGSIDASGNIWIFDGTGYPAASPSGYLCDLWRFSRSTKQWTWIRGLYTTPLEPNEYGTKGVLAFINMPTGKEEICQWIDRSGNLWLFGGFGITKKGWGPVNELWKYNFNNLHWVWMSGDDRMPSPGEYGTSSISAATNKPGGRQGGVS